jgi:hypothetical protein
MSRPPPASGDHARSRRVPFPLTPTAADAQDILAERAALLRDFIGEARTTLQASTLFELSRGHQ